jgi:predicted dehydrogenase
MTARVGIIGLGFGVAVHLPAFRAVPGVQVVALGGRDASKARELATHHGIALGGSADAVFASKPDIVTVALPPDAGAALALKAVENGFAVLAEKPLAENLARARQLAQAAAGRTTAVGFEFSELDCFQQLKRQVDAARPRALSVSWRTRSLAQRAAWSWKLDAERHGGVMNLIGSHALFQAEWLVGPLQWLSARFSSERTQRMAPPGARCAEERAHIRGETAAGIAVEIELDNAADHARQEWSVDGRRALEDQDIVKTGPVDWRIEPFRRLARRFVDCVARRSPCVPGFAEGLRVQQLIDAARCSAAGDGERVDVSA